MPASGSYLWDSTGLPDLNTYYIVADVFDKVGETGESQVGEFTIDHSVPFFTVTSNPSITKGEDVEIDVSSSKDLVTPPTLEVTQNNFVPTPVELTGTGKSFKGVYKVVSGYDGQASISVSGTDALGNMSSKILSGGSFQVGELTLKKPIVDSPKNNATVRTDQISVTGRGESGTQVVVSVNGGKQYKVSTDNSGNFVFNNISLDKNSNAGHNFLTLFAANNGGDASPAVSLEITVASPAATSSAPASPAAPEGESVPAQGLPPISPEPAVAPEALPAQTSATSTLEPASPVASPLSVDLLYPREGRGVSGVAEIDWQPDEAHLGKIKSATLSYRRGSGPYQIIVDNITYQKVLWDVSSLKEGGDYELKLDATDGVSKVEVKRKIIVDNTAPTINVTMVSKAASTTPYTLQASGTATDNLSGVDFIEYSLDGDHWFKADISGANLKDKVQFSLKYPFKLDDGDYIVRYRAVDGAGNNSKIYLSDIKLDQHAPRIGSYVISKGSIILLPDGDKKFELQADDTLNFKISLETDTASSSLTVAGIEYPMTRGDDGLWRTDFNIQNLGDYDLLISAADQGGKSFEERKIGEVGVKPNGVVAPGAQITAYVLDEAEKSYVRWQGEEFGIANPLTAGADGQYSLLLPAGKYYLKIQKDGFEKLRTNAFELTTPSYINFNFGLTRLAGLNAIIEPIIDKLMFYEN